MLERVRPRNRLSDEGLVESIQTYPNAQREIFGSRARGKPEPRNIKKLIVMLIAAKILTYRITWEETDAEKKNPIVLGRLNIDEDTNDLCLTIPSYWERIPMKPALDD